MHDDWQILVRFCFHSDMFLNERQINAFAFSENDHSFNDIPEFPNITGPWIVFHILVRFIRNTSEWNIVLKAYRAGKVVSKKRVSNEGTVLETLRQREQA